MIPLKIPEYIRQEAAFKEISSTSFQTRKGESMKAIDFTSLLTSALAGRVVRNQPTLISLVAGIPVLFRPRKAFNATDKVHVAQLAGGSSAWQPFGKISRLLDWAVPGLNSRWAEILLPLLTISACDWATRLAKQMGAELTTSVNLDVMKR